jgi:hypothetical protein
MIERCFVRGTIFRYILFIKNVNLINIYWVTKYRGKIVDKVLGDDEMQGVFYCLIIHSFVFGLRLVNLRVDEGRFPSLGAAPEDQEESHHQQQQQQAAHWCCNVGSWIPTTLWYTVKKGCLFSRPQPGCH